jgi:hypothetical protein
MKENNDSNLPHFGSNANDSMEWASGNTSTNPSSHPQGDTSMSSSKHANPEYETRRSGRHGRSRGRIRVQPQDRLHSFMRDRNLPALSQSFVAAHETIGNAPQFEPSSPNSAQNHKAGRSKNDFGVMSAQVSEHISPNQICAANSLI